MSEAQPKNHAQSHDSEKAQERKRLPEPGQQQVPGAAGETASFVSLVGESVMDLPEDRHAALLSDPRLAHRANAVQRARLVSGIQQSYGNRHLQRVLNRTRAPQGEGHEGGQAVIQRTPLHIEAADVGVYDFLLQTRDRFPRFRGVETGQIQANSLQFGARNYTLHPTPELEEGQTVSLRLGEGVFFLRPASASGIRALAGGVYDIHGVDERGNLEATGLQVSTQGLHSISEGILVYSARVQHIAETRVTVRAPRDTEALARQIAEIVSGAGRLTAPGTVARQIVNVLGPAHLTHDEMMDVLQRLETAHEIGHFLELVRMQSFRQFLRERGVSWQYIFMNWQASINDCGQVFAGFVIGAGESVVDAVRLISTLVGATFSEELADDAGQFFRAIGRFFEDPIGNTVRAVQDGYHRFVNHMWNLELFEAGRILGNVVVLLLTLPEAVRAIPSLARAVTRLSVRAIQETFGVSRAVLRRFARSQGARLVTREGHVLMQAGDDIVVVGEGGQTARISRADVLEEAARGSAPTEPAVRGSAPTEPAVRGSAPTEPAVRGSAPTEPAVRGSAPTEPAVRGSAPTEPAVRGSAPTEPAVRGSAPTEPAVRGSAPTEPAVRGSAPTEPATRGSAPTERAVEPTGGAAGTLREFRTEAAARQIRDEVVGRGRGGWNGAFSEEHMVADWHAAGGTGEPPLAFIDRNGHLVFDARRLGLAPEEMLVEGTRARMARRPPPPPAEAPALPTIQAEILNAEFAGDMVQCWRQAGNPVLLRTPDQIQRLWQAAGRTGEPPVGWVNAQGGLIVNRELVGGS